MRTMLRAACLLALVGGLGTAAASAAEVERLALVERVTTDVVTPIPAEPAIRSATS